MTTADSSATTTHRLLTDAAPHAWHLGYPLGNGELGAMVWGGSNRLCWTLDRADLWDLRENDTYQRHPDWNWAGLRRLLAEGRHDEAFEIFEERQRLDNLVGPTKISIGRVELTLDGAPDFAGGLDLDRAVFEARVGGGRTVSSFVCRTRNVLCLAVDPWPADQTLRLVPLAETCGELATLGHPAPRLFADGELRGLVQQIPDGPAYAVVYNASGPQVYVAVESAATAAEAEQRARATWSAAAKLGFAALRTEHETAWAEFWGVSAVRLPEADAETLWYYGVYLLASCARRGATPPGLQGLWAMDGVMPPWRGDYHADMNVQETFWPALGSGHLDLLDCWCDHMMANLAACQALTRRFFGSDGTFWVCSSLPEYVLVPCWAPVQWAWSHTGWLAHLVWLRWRYSLDTTWLAEVGYPLMAEAFRFYRANLAAGDDGRLHVPLSNSPEFRDNTPAAWCHDPNIDLALIRRCCAWLREMEAALDRHDLSGEAARVHESLTPYALDEGGALMLWPGQPLTESHRHPSHLMAIHPAMDLTIAGGDQERAVIHASLDRYCALGQWLWTGHTYGQMIGLAAVVGRGGMAYEFLRQLIDHWLAPNGLHFNRDLDNCGMSGFRLTQPFEDTASGAAPFTIEANCALSQGIADMLVQGWHDVVRIFPAIPRRWRDVAFRDLRCEGAWRVSAERRDGRTLMVTVRAGVDRELVLSDPFDGAEVIMTGAELCREAGRFEGALRAGQEVVLRRRG